MKTGDLVKFRKWEKTMIRSCLPVLEPADFGYGNCGLVHNISSDGSAGVYWPSHGRTVTIDIGLLEIIS